MATNNRVKPTDKYAEYERKLDAQRKYIDASLNGELIVLESVEYRQMYDGGVPNTSSFHVVLGRTADQTLVYSVHRSGHGKNEKRAHFNFRGGLIQTLKDLHGARQYADNDTRAKIDAEVKILAVFLSERFRQVDVVESGVENDFQLKPEFTAAHSLNY